MATCGQQQMAMASGQAGSWLAAGNVRPDAILTVNMSSEFLYIRFGSCKLIVQNCRRRNVFPLLHPLPATLHPPAAICQLLLLLLPFYLLLLLQLWAGNL